MKGASDKVIPVIDLFAGPGGLGEGFSAYQSDDGHMPFQVRLSVEKDKFAHETLTLRSFFRHFPPGEVPEPYYEHVRGKLSRESLLRLYPTAAAEATQEAKLATLGEVPHEEVDGWITSALAGSKNWVLVGGPPCQAYSVAGRSRNRGVKGYNAEKDGRHFLYREYLRIISYHWPAVFVFENVKGLLSSEVNGNNILKAILDDLRDPGRVSSGEQAHSASEVYRVFSLGRQSEGDESDVPASDFIVRAEDFGIPQARHRLFLLGVRSDIVSDSPGILDPAPPIPCSQVLQGLPPIRSMLPRSVDAPGEWLQAVREARTILGEVQDAGGAEVAALFESSLSELEVPKANIGASFVECDPQCSYRPDWFVDERMKGVVNHEGRNHMASDLHRYLYAACYAKVHGKATKLRDFPRCLLPNHRNVEQALGGGYFQDRFRVQLEDAPSTTITSHIAKDGHHFIHPDPLQCRSLSPREAARIQTFPDNYFFCGPRTAQYTQIGNAVPPLLALQIAGIVDALLK